jgi:hypothetical protein
MRIIVDGGYRAVTRVEIIQSPETGRSRGFGFSEMPAATEGNAAMAGLQGAMLGGRPLTVKGPKWTLSNNPFVSPLQHFPPSEMPVFPGYGAIQLIDLSYHTRIQEELGIPADRELVAVTEVFPLGWRHYAFDLIGTREVADDSRTAPRFWLHGSPPQPKRKEKKIELAPPQAHPYKTFDLYSSDPDIVIAWRRRVAYEKARAWIEVRWHPIHGETVTVHHEASTLPLKEAKDAHEGLLHGLTLIRTMGQPGRPPVDYATFAQEYKDAYHRLQAAGHRRPSHEMIAGELCIEKRSLQHRIKKVKEDGNPWPPE